jgi:hypothetical protein
VAAFEYPLALLLGLPAEPGLFRRAPFHPAGLPVDLVDVDDREPGALAKRAGESAFA